MESSVHKYSIKDIEDRINPHLLGLLKLKEEYDVMERNPLSLLTVDRFDLMAKYIYGWCLKNKVAIKWGENVYKNHLKVWSDFNENDGSGKGSFEDFKNTFQNLLHDIENNGFNEKISLLPVGNDNVLIDGAHRLSASMVYEAPVKAVEFEHDCNSFDYTFFQRKGLDETTLDAMALQYAKLHKNTHIVVLFPVAQHKDEEVKEIIAKHSTIVYHKKVNYYNEGPKNLIWQLYQGEDWLGGYDKVSKGVLYHINEKFRANIPTQFFLVESNSLYELVLAKTKIRELFNLGNNSIHINDTHEETVRIGEQIFNQNSIYFFNFSKFQNNENFWNLFSEFKKWIKNEKLNKDFFCIDGSSVMAVYGLRDSQDLDYLNWGYDNVVCHNELIGSHNEEIKYYSNGLDEIIFNPQYHFYFDGIKFVSLNVLLEMKKRRNEVKDERDILLIKKVNVKVSRLALLKKELKYFLQYQPRRLKIKIKNGTPAYAWNLLKKAKRLTKFGLNMLKHPSYLSKRFIQHKFLNSYIYYPKFNLSVFEHEKVVKQYSGLGDLILNSIKSSTKGKCQFIDLNPDLGMLSYYLAFHHPELKIKITPENRLKRKSIKKLFDKSNISVKPDFLDIKAMHEEHASDSYNICHIKLDKETVTIINKFNGKVNVSAWYLTKPQDLIGEKLDYLNDLIFWANQNDYSIETYNGAIVIPENVHRVVQGAAGIVLTLNK